jgi:hypothetical protein
MTFDIPIDQPMDAFGRMVISTAREKNPMEIP